MGLFDTKEQKAEKAYQAGLQARKKGKEDKAVSCFSKAAELGHPAAQYERGLFCQCSENPELCNGYAMGWFEKAARQGYLPALLRCVTRYLDPDDPVCKPSRGRDWAEKAKALDLPPGDEQAMQLLQYASPEGLFALSEQAMQAGNFAQQNLLNELAAKEGHPRALLRLGERWRTGLQDRLPGPNLKAAFRCFERAAEQDGLALLATLWMAYFENGKLGTDPKKVLGWAKSRLKKDPAIAYFWVLYQRSRGSETETDPKLWLQACEWAAEQGIPGEALACARLYAAGQGIPADFARAAAFYETAIAGGSLEAVVGLGELCQIGGPGLARDTARAMELYGRAAEKAVNPGNRKKENFEQALAGARGLARQAEMLFQGEGARQDRESGLRLYLRAARCFGTVFEETLREVEKEIGSGETLQLAALLLGRAFYNAGLEREAFPLLQWAGEFGFGYLNAMLLLTTLFYKGIPVLQPRDMDEVDFWYSAWLRHLTEGEDVTFGSCSQDVMGADQPIHWTVLSVQDGRVLLLSRNSLEYAHRQFDREGWGEAYTDTLFTPIERAFLDGPLFLLSRAEFERYVLNKEGVEPLTQVTLIARKRKAGKVGMEAVIRGKVMTVYCPTDETYVISTEGGTYEEWNTLLTTLDSSWLLQDGAVCNGRWTDRYNINRMTLRPAVWIRLPQDARGKKHAK